jgi:hypothetical protein
MHLSGFHPKQGGCVLVTHVSADERMTVAEENGVGDCLLPTRSEGLVGVLTRSGGLVGVLTRSGGLVGVLTRNEGPFPVPTRNKGLLSVLTRIRGMNEVVQARGHDNVTARHASTLEVTSDDYLTQAGDCILGVEADRVPAEFDDAFVANCQSSDSTIVGRLEAGGHTERVEGRGHPDLTFASERSLVCRTSEYVDDRTVAVGMDRAAGDLDREFVAALADGAKLRLTLTVE